MKNMANIQRALVAILFSVLLVSCTFVGCKPTPTPAPPPPTPSTPPSPAIELKFGSAVPEVILVSQPFKWWMDEIEKRTNKRVTFKRYWAGTLVSAPDVLNATSKRVVDIVHGVHIYVPGQVPLGAFAYNFPFNPPDPMVETAIHHKMYDAVPALSQELGKFNIIKPLFFVAIDPYDIISKVPIKTIDDFKGLKITHTGVEQTPLFEAIGGTSVIAPMGEFYTRLERGVVDAGVAPLGLTADFKLQEAAKFYVSVRFFAAVPNSLWMNADAWKSLTPELQRLFTQVGLEAEENHLKVNEAHRNKSKDTLEKAGVNFYDLPQSELNKWVKVMPDIATKWAKNMEDKGLPGWNVVDTYIKLTQETGYKWPRVWGVR